VNETGHKPWHDLHFADTLKKPTESLKTISEILNAVPVTEYHNRPELVMNDGLRLSVQGRDNSVNLGCSCSPKSSVGPWTALEVGFPDRWVARLLPFIEGGEDNPVNPPEESVYHYVPAEVLTKIIEEAGGVAGYWYEGKLHKVGTICDGLMWMLGTYGYPKAHKVEHAGLVHHPSGHWYIGGDIFATQAEALEFLAEYAD
jgi:hypothetical protein